MMSNYSFMKMASRCDNKLTEGKGYVSCIKINGNPILPPLITPERRLELQIYKKEAIDRERHLKCRKDLKTYIDKLDSCNLQLGKTNRTDNPRSLEHILSFGDDESPSNTNALNNSSISSDKNNNDQNELPSNCKDNNNSKTDVPSSDTKQKKEKDCKFLNLTCNVFDVTEYSNNGIVIFNRSDITDKLVASSVELDLSDINSEKKSDISLVEICQTKPRIRSNSYTLESPSPILLEHLRKQATNDDITNDLFKFDKRAETKRRSLDLGSSFVNENSLDDFRSEYVTTKANTSINGCDLTSVQKDVVKDLAEKHFGPISESKKTDDLSCLNEKNLELQGLPDDYIKGIIEFLDRYRNEQEMKLKSIRDELNNNENPIPKSDNCEPLNASTPLLIDFESDSCDTEPVMCYDVNSSFTYSESMRTMSSYEQPSTQRDLSSVNCSRELFPENPKKVEQKLKQRWAATILTAAAKGYLVRRLKRTERVRNLIQTIQEALICAMSLHMESNEDIRPPDVELHRRLIQQVSAACYEFYDIFFNLTTKEQMVLISLDRQRLQEKLKRPKSVGSSARLSSGRSSVRSQQSLSGKQRKSLTPTFAA